MKSLDIFLFGLGLSFLAGILAALIAVGVGVLLNKRVRRKATQFVRLFGWIDAAKVSLFGNETIRVSTANSEPTSGPAAKPTQVTNSSNTSLNWAVIRREDQPGSLGREPFIASGSVPSQTNSTFVR